MIWLVLVLDFRASTSCTYVLALLFPSLQQYISIVKENFTT